MATYGVTMFRARDGEHTLDDILPRRSDLKFQEFRLDDDRERVALVYYRTRPANPPAWAGFFEDIVDPAEFSSQSSSAVIVFQRDERWYAVTFGYGRTLIDLDRMEPSFGLRSTLNAIDAALIRSIDKKRVDAVSRMTREQLSRDSRIGTFGLDIHQDLLSAVTGVPQDEGLGPRLHGKDAISLKLDVSPGQLGRVADRLEDLFLRNDYREAFPWVDNIAEVRSGEERNRLDRELVRQLSDGDHDFRLAPPEIVDWSTADRFIWPRDDGLRRIELALEDYHNLIRPRDDISLDRLRSDRVGLVDGNGNRVSGWSVYRCLSGELEVEGGRYVISDGAWYQIDRDFAQEVDDAVEAITIPGFVDLPAYTRDHRDEAHYNARAAERSNGELFLMDQQFIYPRSWQDRIEFCDLLRGDLTMIHVKRFSGGSASLSHLFAQGSVAIRCLLEDPSFRREVDERVPEQFRIGDARPEPNDCRIVYAVVAEPGRQPRLPFFSRVALRNSADFIRRLGASVVFQSVANEANQ